MKNIILGLVLCASPLLTKAHNPLAAYYHFVADSTASILTINLSQDGVNQMLYKKYGAELLDSIELTAYKELIVTCIKDDFSLTIDGSKMELEKGGIRLGSHQTDLKFVLGPVPAYANQISVDIPAFAENEAHQTIFSFQVNDSVDKVILSESNQFESMLFIREEFSTLTWNWKWGLAMGFSICTLLLLRYLPFPVLKYYQV